MIFFPPENATLKAAVQEVAASLESPAAAAAAAAAGGIPYGDPEGYYYYDRTKSFYDKISSTSIEKNKQYSQPVAQPSPSKLICLVCLICPCLSTRNLMICLNPSRILNRS